MTEKIKRFIELNLAVTACNMRCGYCYVRQRGEHEKTIPDLPYSPETIRRALSKKRLGGRAFINFCAEGETLLHRSVPDLVREFLAEGHVVRLFSNLTLSDRVDKLLEIPRESLRHLIVCGSYHYNELVRLGKLDEYFANILKIRAAGASSYAYMTLGEEYLSKREEILAAAASHGIRVSFGAVRDDSVSKLYETSLSPAEYNQKVDEFTRGQFRTKIDFERKYFGVKRREFCYAGDWSLCVDIISGNVSKCYYQPTTQNIYRNIDTPLTFSAVGRGCAQPWCTGGVHFLAFGMIPELTVTPFSEIIAPADLSDELKELLSTPLGAANKPYGFWRRLGFDVVSYPRKISRGVHNAWRRARGKQPK